MGTMATYLLWIWCAFACGALLMPGQLNAEQSVPEEIRDLQAFYDTAKMYPSMTPRSYIKVGYGFLLSKIPGELPTYLVDPESPSSWVLRKIGDQSSEFTPERVDVTIAEGVAYLFLKPDTVKKGDKLEVAIRVRKRTATGEYRPYLIKNKDKVTIGETDSYTLQIEPGVVPDQELDDGTKKTVGHFQIKLDVPSLIQNEKIARFYIKSDNLFSTSSLDKTTKVELKAGAERSLTRFWYIPFNGELMIIGNQTFENGSFVASVGSKTILPWGWTRPYLFRDGIKAPVSPEFELSLQYERRFEQDLQVAVRHANKNSARVFGQVSWNPIHLLPGKDYSPRDISIELLAKGWWFPEEKTNRGNRVSSLEGRLELSLLVPLSVINISDGKLIKTPTTGAASRLRIKYSDGANEANGFTRSSEFTFAVEVLK